MQYHSAEGGTGLREIETAAGLGNGTEACATASFPCVRMLGAAGSSGRPPRRSRRHVDSRIVSDEALPFAFPGDFFSDARDGTFPQTLSQGDLTRFEQILLRIPVHRMHEGHLLFAVYTTR